jgi:hypothetical protein
MRVKNFDALLGEPANDVFALRPLVALPYLARLSAAASMQSCRPIARLVLPSRSENAIAGRSGQSVILSVAR